MLQTQVNYWTLMENRRHNLESERQGRENVDINRYQASSGRMQAEASQQTAIANLQNAESNRRNAESNAENARTNRFNAFINQQNAETNARNADINAWNASTNQKNAVSNRIQAEAAKTQAGVAVSDLNRKWQETDFNYTEEGAGFKNKQRETAAAEKRAEGTYMSGQAAQLNSWNDTPVKDSEVDQNKAFTEEALTGSSLNEAKTKTEGTQQSLNTARTVKTYVDSVNSAWELGKDIASTISGWVTSKKKQTGNWLDQMNDYLDKRNKKEGW
jgi:hypothetical protein